jgi:hypothetical protein
MEDKKVVWLNVCGRRFYYIEKRMRLLLFIILLFFALSFAQEQQNDADKRASLLGTVQVTKVHSLDEIKGSYKSPRRALFMSLLLPGSGQLYVGGKQSRYVRGVFYLAEEAALISGLYYRSIYKYDKQVKRYKNFATDHFSITKYEKAMNSIYDPDYDTHFKNLYGQERESYCKAFYGNSALSKTCTDNFGKNANASGEPSNPDDGTPLYNSSAYYSAIASGSFVLGWEDAKLTPGIETNLGKEEPADMPLGSSNYYGEYLSMRKKANKLADSQALFLGALILNHIVSAADAMLSARAHNNSLYEEGISFLDRIRLDSNFSVGENFKAEAGLRWVW